MSTVQKVAGVIIVHGEAYLEEAVIGTERGVINGCGAPESRSGSKSSIDTYNSKLGTPLSG